MGEEAITVLTSGNKEETMKLLLYLTVMPDSTLISMQRQSLCRAGALPYASTQASNPHTNANALLPNSTSTISFLPSSSSVIADVHMPYSRTTSSQSA
jgi:hypothetical protein